MDARMKITILTFFLLIPLIDPAFGISSAFKDNIYDPGTLKPIDSQLKVRIGDEAPDIIGAIRDVQ